MVCVPSSDVTLEVTRVGRCGRLARVGNLPYLLDAVVVVLIVGCVDCGGLRFGLVSVRGFLTDVECRCEACKSSDGVSDCEGVEWVAPAVVTGDEGSCVDAECSSVCEC